jgi:dihydroxy-acid dehydratase
MICFPNLLNPILGHIVPEAQEGGPIGLVRDGDEIVIDAEARRLDVILPEGELDRRAVEFVPKPLKYTKGTLYKYAK